MLFLDVESSHHKVRKGLFVLFVAADVGAHTSPHDLIQFMMTIRNPSKMNRMLNH
jgi:hypothetical protein